MRCAYAWPARDSCRNTVATLAYTDLGRQSPESIDSSTALGLTPRAALEGVPEDSSRSSNIKKLYRAEIT